MSIIALAAQVRELFVGQVADVVVVFLDGEQGGRLVAPVQFQHLVDKPMPENITIDGLVKVQAQAPVKVIGGFPDAPRTRPRIQHGVVVITQLPRRR